MKINHNEVHPYPAYQKSSLPWVEKIPQHWRITNVKRHFQVRIGKMLTTEPQTPTDVEVPYLKALNVQWNVVNTNNVHTMWASQDEARQLEIRPGDLLVCEGGEGGRAAIVIDPPKGFIFQNALHRVRAKHGSLNPYLLRVMYGIASSGWFDALNNKATIAHFTKEKFEALVIPIPPLDEQAAIVRYLDHADELIDRYISAKERLIALMREQRQAVIHQAVTRGLDPNVPLKPSGVSWLGDMPRHWESPRLRYMGNAIIGLTYAPQNVTDVGGGTLVFRASNIRDGRITYEDCVYVGSRVPSLLITRPGDILICSRSGSRALIGKNAKIDVNSAGNTFGAFMTVFRSETNDYLHYVFNSNMFEHQSAMFATSTVNQLTLGMINDMKTPFPPPHEQEMIVGYLDQATAKIDQAIIQTKRQIDLTKEYRTRLIADVVTGQIDVRNATVELHV